MNEDSSFITPLRLQGKVRMKHKTRGIRHTKGCLGCAFIRQAVTGIMELNGTLGIYLILYTRTSKALLRQLS